MCGSKRGEATGGEFHDMYTSRNIMWVARTRLMRWAMHLVRIGKPKAKRSVEACRHALDGTVKM
jgi:hypothetical protein